MLATSGASTKRRPPGPRRVSMTIPSKMSALASASTCSTTPIWVPLLACTGVPSRSVRYEAGSMAPTLPAQAAPDERGHDPEWMGERDARRGKRAGGLEDLRQALEPLGGAAAIGLGAAERGLQPLQLARGGTLHFGVQAGERRAQLARREQRVERIDVHVALGLDDLAVVVTADRDVVVAHQRAR